MIPIKRNVLLQAMRLVWQKGKLWCLFSIAVSIVLGLLPVASLWIIKELVNTVTVLVQNPAAADSGSAILYLLLQFGITLLTSILQNAQSWFDRSLEIRLTYDLERSVLEKAAEVPLGYFDISEFYHHMSRVRASGTQFLSPFRSLLTIGKTGITLVSVLIFLLSIHWSLLVFSMVAAVPMFLVQKKFGKKRFVLMHAQTPNEREAGYAAYLLKSRDAAQEVRVFGLQGFLLGRWAENFLSTSRASLRLVRDQQTANVALDAASALFLGGAGGMLIWLIESAKLGVGEFVVIGQAIQTAQGSLNTIAGQMAQLYEQSLYLDDYYRFLSYEEQEVPALQGTKPLPERLQRGIEVESLSYRYPHSGRVALHDISFQIQPGERIAIVGGNGSGKTTLIKCLIGLYLPSSGTVRYEGIPVEELDPQHIRRLSTVIFQDFIRYNYTAAENVVLGETMSPDVQQRMGAVICQTGADSFLNRLPNGPDTRLGRALGDGVGEDLSGGQWQKIALARALFRQGEILILDEPTAALDPLAELEVFRQFDQMTRNKTAIFISHRMASAKLADRILVMDGGRLVEMGTHQELMERDQLYAQMYRAQAEWYEHEVRTEVIV